MGIFGDKTEVTPENKDEKQQPQISKGLKLSNHTKYTRRLSAATYAS